MWRSPYQSAALADALGAAGIDTAAEKGVIATGLGGAGLTAWELARAAGRPLPWPAFVFSDILPLDAVQWRPGSYHTLLAEDEAGFSSACRRKIEAARRAGVTVVSGGAATDALALFAAHPQLRGNLDGDRFAALADAVRAAGVGELFAARTPEGVPCAAALVLRSPDIVNLRFSAVDRRYGQFQPMRLLIAAIRNSHPGHILDLSGFTPPALADARAQSINRFKRDFGHRVALFEPEP